MAKATAKEFWIVTRPTQHSVIEDICFKTDWRGLALQFRGGLDGEEVYGLYHHEQPARNVAQSLLDVRDGKLPREMVQS